MKNVAQISDVDILEGIRTSNPDVIKGIYRAYLPGIITYIRRNSGGEEDARDLFQEAMIVLFRKVKAGNFELRSSLNTYLSSICRNLWYKRLRDRKEVSIPEGIERPDPDEDLDQLIHLTVQRRLFLQHFQQLGETCREILELYFQKVSMREIAEKLQTTEGYLKKRKFVCKEKVVKAIQQDPLYQEASA
jgi:RNA polymerase sigma factor (sigma-70 family)